jgi:hypothetical protein
VLSELHSLNLKLCSKQYNKKLFCTWLWCHSYAVAGDITTQPKQGRQAGLMSSLCILLYLWFNRIEGTTNRSKTMILWLWSVHKLDLKFLSKETKSPKMCIISFIFFIFYLLFRQKIRKITLIKGAERCFTRVDALPTDIRLGWKACHGQTL